MSSIRQTHTKCQGRNGDGSKCTDWLHAYPGKKGGRKWVHEGGYADHAAMPGVIPVTDTEHLETLARLQRLLGTFDVMSDTIRKALRTGNRNDLQELEFTLLHGLRDL